MSCHGCSATPAKQRNTIHWLATPAFLSETMTLYNAMTLFICSHDFTNGSVTVYTLPGTEADLDQGDAGLWTLAGAI